MLLDVARRAFQPFSIGNVQLCWAEGFKERFRSLVGCARQVEPQRHLSIREGIW
jgi:hypothetical protein